MKPLLKLTGCLALAGLFASCQSAQQDANYQIIPMPQEIVTAQGNPFILKSGVKILYPEGNEKMQRKIPGRLSENGYRKRFRYRGRNGR